MPTPLHEHRARAHRAFGTISSHYRPGALSLYFKVGMPWSTMPGTPTASVQSPPSSCARCCDRSSGGMALHGAGPGCLLDGAFFLASGSGPGSRFAVRLAIGVDRRRRGGRGGRRRRGGRGGRGRRGRRGWRGRLPERLVGDAAKNQAAMNTVNTVFDAKRLIGRRFSDAATQADLKHFPCMPRARPAPGARQWRGPSAVARPPRPVRPGWSGPWARPASGASRWRREPATVVLL